MADLDEKGALRCLYSNNWKAFLAELARLSLWMDYQSEVDETRHLSQTVF
jgi:hypothetical protein